MRAKIQKSMLLIIIVTLIATFLLMSTMYYVERLENMQEEVQQEAIYVRTAIEVAGIECLVDMDNAQAKTRLTLINENGDVVYDSKSNEYDFGSHATRQEVKDAFLTGHGEAMRNSKTVNKQTYYYAILLENGMVLRASKTIDNLIPTILRTIPYLTGIAVIMIVLAYYLAKWQTKRLIKPINELDPAKPLENDVFLSFAENTVKKHNLNINELDAKDKILLFSKSFTKTGFNNKGYPKTDNKAHISSSDEGHRGQKRNLCRLRSCR